MNPTTAQRARGAKAHQGLRSLRCMGGVLLWLGWTGFLTKTLVGMCKDPFNLACSRNYTTILAGFLHTLSKTYDAPLIS